MPSRGGAGGSRNGHRDASIAVVGPHNAGKTTHAVVTSDPRAVDDISQWCKPACQRLIATRPRTPPSRFGIPLASARSTSTKTKKLAIESRRPIVVLAISPDLVSQKGRDQLAELLHIGRKRGAVLPVVTKADREPADNQAGIALTLREALPQLGREFTFVAAGDVLDARLEGEPEPNGTGIAEFISALEDLATGEARRRVHATSAVRLLVLCERSEEQIGGEEPEQEVALTSQRRIRKVLLRLTVRLVEASTTISR